MTGPELQDDARQEFRPSLRTYLRTRRTPAQLFNALVLAFAVAVHAGSGRVALAVVTGGTVLLVVLLMVAWHLVARIRITDHALERRDLLGRTRRVPRGDVASALLMPGFRRSGDPATGLLVFLDDRRRPLLRLDGTWWGTDRLSEIADAGGAPVTVVGDDLTPLEIAWRRSYVLPWRDRHPVLVEFVGLVGVVALLIGGFLLLPGET